MDDIKEDLTFESLGLCSELLDACERLNYKKPTQIQAKTLPHSLQKKDIIGLAQTGSGKTAAFALPILQSLLHEKPPPKSVYAVVVAPTRELVFQIHEQFEALGSAIGAKCIALAGGVDKMAQAIALAKNPHILVVSPGRLVDHLENTKGFHLKKVKFLVLDEADRLLNMEFEKELDTILSVLPRDRTSFLFSATMTSKVNKLQRASLKNPIKIEVCDKYATVDTLIQNYLFIPAKYKDCYLTYLCNEFAGNSIIVFVDTQNTAQRTAYLLRNLGFPAICIHGGMTQSKRLSALHKFKAKERKILIATDVASRGLDIPAVDLVLNYDIPTHGKDYVHRVGRTARAGRSGRAISLVSQYDVDLYQKVETLIGRKLDAFPCEERIVLMLYERVYEAQRLANTQLRELGTLKKGSKRGRNQEEDAEDASNFDADGQLFEKDTKRKSKKNKHKRSKG